MRARNFQRSHDAKRVARDVPTLLEDLTVAESVANMSRSDVYRERLHALAENPLLFDANRAVVRAWESWLAENRTRSLSARRQRILDMLEAMAKGARITGKAFGWPKLTVLSEETFQRKSEAKTRAERPDWMVDASLLPRRPPGR